MWGSQFPTPNFPFPLLLNQINLRFRLLPLLILHQSMQLDAELYEGAAQATANKLFFRNKGDFNAEIQQIELGEHPLGTAFGVRGRLSVKASGEFQTDISNSQPPINATSFELQLVDGQYRGGHKIAGLLLIPQADKIEVFAKGTLNKLNFRIREGSISSSLGKVSLEGAGEMNQSPRDQKFEFEIKLSLSDQGASSFGPYLALAAGGTTDSSVKNWEISISKQRGANMPQFKISAQPS